MEPPSIYAHRAGRGLFPENTIEAMEQLEDVDVIDFDVGLTKDCVLVATHDTTLSPDVTRDQYGNYITERIPICALTFDELQTFDVGQINPLSTYAQFFPHQQRLDGVRIPRIEEVIERADGRRLQLEIKLGGKRHPEELWIRAVEKIAIPVEIQCFDHAFLERLPERFIRSCVTYQGDIPTTGEIWCPYQMDVTKERVVQAHECGLQIVPWGYPEKEGTEFNRGVIESLIDWGVDGIIVDRPDLLRLMLHTC